MKSKQTMLLILIFILISVRCDTTEPPIKGSLSLTVEDVSCTEVWITLKTTDLPLPTSIILKQNDITRSAITLATSDTVLYIDSLFPKQNYAFQVTSIQHQVSSNQATAATLDTTSHSFSWQTFTFGQHSSSTLYDVAIINENNIWAVGEIYMKDSLGNIDHKAYNAVHWDGQSWELKRIFFPTVCGSTSTTSYPAKAIFAFDDGQIWISSSGDKIARLQNGVQIDKFCLPSNVSMSINKLWGSSSNDLYAVGNGGNIAHYKNGAWKKIESVTDVNLRDVWGSPDGSIVWAVGFQDSYGTVFLKNTGNGFEKVLEITDPNMPHPLNKITHVFKSLWTDKIQTIYLGAIGRVYAAPKNTTGYAKENIWWDYNQTEFPPETNIIRGTAGNDIFVGGYLLFVRHWNGANWKGYHEIEGDGSWRGMDVNDNLIIAVGENYNFPATARITIGYRVR